MRNPHLHLCFSKRKFRGPGRGDFYLYAANKTDIRRVPEAPIPPQFKRDLVDLSDTVVLASLLATGMSDPIAEFFSRFPNSGFTFTPSRNDDWRQRRAFNAFANYMEWKQEERDRLYREFQDCWMYVFQNEVGTSKLEHYQNVCKDLGMDPIPNSIGGCRELLRSVYVNIVDLTQYRIDLKEGRNPAPILQFDSEDDLKMYSKKEDKLYPSDLAKGELLKDLLRVFKT